MDSTFGSPEGLGKKAKQITTTTRQDKGLEM